MRVLHVMEATIGGTRRHLVDLVRGLARAGVDVHVAAAAERAPDFREELAALEREGAGVLELPMLREIRPLTDARHLRRLGAHLQQLRPDVVHTHSSKAGVLGRRASLATGIGRRVHTPHTFAFLFGSMFGPGKRLAFRAIERHLGRRTDRMIAVSETEAATIAAAGVIPAERIRVVPNAIDPRPWAGAAPMPRERIGVPAGAPLAAVVGLLNVAKGQDLAIRALAEPGCERLHLAVAGTGEDEPDLRALAAGLGVEQRVHFLGWVDDAPALLAASDLLLLPSRWEGMPYVCLEAMAAGLPVVATAVDGARDLVLPGRTGELVPVESPEALARATARLLALEPEARRALGRAGRERVLAGHGLDDMVAGTLAVYRELAA